MISPGAEWGLLAWRGGAYSAGLLKLCGEYSHGGSREVCKCGGWSSLILQGVFFREKTRYFKLDIFETPTIRGCQKGGFPKGWFSRMYPRSGFLFRGNMRTYPRSGFRSRGTSECTFVPVFVLGEHAPKPPFWKTTLLSTPGTVVSPPNKIRKPNMIFTKLQNILRFTWGIQVCLHLSSTTLHLRALSKEEHSS